MGNNGNNVPPQWLHRYLEEENRGWMEWNPDKGIFMPVEKRPNLTNSRKI